MLRFLFTSIRLLPSLKSVAFQLTIATVLLSFHGAASESDGSWKIAIIKIPHIVTMKGDHKATLKEFTARRKRSTLKPAEFTMEIVKKLEKQTRDAQNEVIKTIEEHPVRHEYDDMWITNQVYLSTVDLELLKKLKKLSSVSSIDVDNATHIRWEPPPKVDEKGAGPKGRSVGKGRSASKTTTGKVQWNIEAICAPRVWAQGYYGNGVLLGFIGGGAKTNHDQLQGKYIYNEFGWYDATGLNAGVPVEDYYYGGPATMRIGEAMADGGYGTAPGARFMACRACAGTDCSQKAFYKCAEFVICPFDRKGKKDCTKAPKAVVIGLEAYYANWKWDEVVTAMDAAGIVVITEGKAVSSHDPNGGEGYCGSVQPHCGTEKSICVASTTQRRRLYSARCGPPKNNPKLIKPDVLAPGYGYKGCFACPQHQEYRGDCYSTALEYTSGSGHIAGIVALMLEKQPLLSHDEIKDIIRKSTNDIANDDPKAPHRCGGIEDTKFPNFVKGYGFVNACLAIENIHCREGDPPRTPRP